MWCLGAKASWDRVECRGSQERDAAPVARRGSRRPEADQAKAKSLRRTSSGQQQGDASGGQAEWSMEKKRERCGSPRVVRTVVATLQTLQICSPWHNRAFSPLPRRAAHDTIARSHHTPHRRLPLRLHRAAAAISFTISLRRLCAASCARRVRLTRGRRSISDSNLNCAALDRLAAIPLTACGYGVRSC